jgi:papain like protease
MASHTTVRGKGRVRRSTASSAPPEMRTFDARQDTLDFRDQMFVASLVEVPTKISLDSYRAIGVPILDQGKEGACTGFGLATVANFLLRVRKHFPDDECVSPWMFYDLARRYDEWPGENYSGSSARGAMKGWHKHGICTSTTYPYDPKDRVRELYVNRWDEATRRPLGAYFRVNHKDIVSMHCAISEVGILYATSLVHSGWTTVAADGHIQFSPGRIGGHAFAIVAYDESGFWIQNSWGPSWGFKGFGRVSYDDWFQNGTDVWVGRLGAPIVVSSAAAAAVGITGSAKGSRAYVFSDLRPHIISIGNDGQFRTDGMYGTSAEDVREIVSEEVPRLTAKWKKKRILLYAHGGLVPEDTAVQHIAEYRAALLEAEVYPLAFVWKTDYWTTLTNMLQDALRRRRPEGVLDATKDFMLDRLDDALEPIARLLTGKAEWDETKKNALMATVSKTGGARLAAQELAKLADSDRSIEIHLAAHSAGAILLGYLVQYLCGDAIPTEELRGEQGLRSKVSSCTLWAPACTSELFLESYAPALEAGRLQNLALFTLTDDSEQADNCAKIYNKSLLYLVSNAFEKVARMPPFGSGVPIAGMAKSLDRSSELGRFIIDHGIDWVRSPNDSPLGARDAARARGHGDFDDDPATLEATLARILGRQKATMKVTTRHSASGQRAIRRQLTNAQ